MNYLDRCTYVENFEPEHTYTFTGPCMVTGEAVSVTVKGSELFAYNRGAKIQDAFPNLSIGEREFIISGTSQKGWDRMFGGGDDEDFDEDEEQGVTGIDVLPRESVSGWTQAKTTALKRDFVQILQQLRTPVRFRACPLRGKE